GKAQIDMPAGIAGIVGMRKAHRKSAKAAAWMPAPVADKLVKRGVERRRIDRLPEWLLSILQKSNDRSGPGCGIIGIARQVAPHDRAALVGEVPRKGIVDADKAVLNELLDLRAAQRTRRVFGRHEKVLISAGPMTLACAWQGWSGF